MKNYFFQHRCYYNTKGTRKKEDCFLSTTIFTTEVEDGAGYESKIKVTLSEYLVLRSDRKEGLVSFRQSRMEGKFPVFQRSIRSTDDRFLIHKKKAQQKQAASFFRKQKDDIYSELVTRSPRRYWRQAVTNNPASVTGTSPSTMPDKRGSTIESLKGQNIYQESLAKRERDEPT